MTSTFNGVSCRRPKPGFTLLELLVVVSILALLVGILLPSFARVRQQSRRAVCMSNLKQIGTAILTYRNQNNDRFPPARTIPEPFVTAAVDDPPLFVTLRREIPRESNVYACPGDTGYVHARCGISYLYNTMLSGKKPEDLWMHRVIDIPPREVPAAFDFDATTADTPTGPVTIPFFHVRRNILFADSHVGDFPPPQPAKAPDEKSLP